MLILQHLPLLQANFSAELYADTTTQTKAEFNTNAEAMAKLICKKKKERILTNATATMRRISVLEGRAKNRIFV